MEEGRRRWEDLETDCLVKVFERLGVEDLAAGASLVCRSWRRASLSPECWKILDFQRIDFMPWGSFASRFKNQMKAASPLPRLSFRSFLEFAVRRSQRSAVELAFPSGCMGMANIDDVVHIADECPRLEVLVLPKLSPEEEERVPGLVAKWSHLRCLEMARKPCCFLELLTQISFNCRSFEALKMSSGWISKEDALTITSLVPRLKHFGLSNGYICKEEMMVILEGCKELRIFEAVNCIGFAVDEEIEKKALGMELFDCRGSKLYYGVGWIESDEDYIEVL
ncbi:F-box/LRR-repeat protein [Canna indica]|uniref:F-box/LRR-repeat protein n=1 Tax=Canna indica TaxID=4628 RepID=A0AAQ3KZ97_9LILI|nr:F-box/LRR-repeat protein [Canna indica]